MEKLDRQIDLMREEGLSVSRSSEREINQSAGFFAIIVVILVAVILVYSFPPPF